ncbi:hypothetical protein CLOM_g10688 [Closterium sp. NIES-68]|nr:hypothetical protein CLOM_g10688 [Closterium sp. NIES-68]GJP60040.1 hypothetical protein CLOP_g17182 [Closterium sp. NIES-67]
MAAARITAAASFLLSASISRAVAAPPASAPLRSAFLPRQPVSLQRASPRLPNRAHSGQPGGAGLGVAGKRGKGARAETQPEKPEGKAPFGYTRLDVILIGVGITAAGFALKYGLEFAGFDSFQSGSVVQLVLVLGLCLVWAASYVWRVGNKEMTYVKQLKDYEDAVMKKRLEAMPETELEAMLAQVEEEKERLRQKKDGSKQ